MARRVSASGSSPHVLRKRQRRRAEILRAALTAFRDKGYHATTLEDIARYLGVRKQALYHYFPDKEAILFECHRVSLAQVSGHLREARRAHRTGTGRLRHVIREHVRVMTETLEGSPLAFEVTALGEARQRQVIAARDRYERGLRAIIAGGVRAGEFRAVDPKVAVFVILGAINWIARWYQPAGTIQGAELGTVFADHLVGGLTCTPPS